MKVEIDLTDTSGFSPSSGDHVVFEAKNLIGSATEPGRVISTAPVRVNLVSGKGTVTLEPGPHLLRVKARNYRDSAPIAFTVPEGQGSMTLRELLEGSFEYEPSVIQDAQAYTAQARSYAEEAATSAKIVGSAKSVLDAAESARGSAAAAAADKSAVAEDRRAVAADRALVEGVRDDAVASINEAVSEASETALGKISKQTEVARGYRNEAESFKESASEFSSNAEAKSAEAAQSANEAASSAANASDSAAASESARASGESLLVEGRSLAEQGHADADRAVAARNQSEQYARSAGEKATAAEQSAQAAAASAESAKQGAPEGGWTKAQLHVNVQAQLDKVDSLPTSQTVQSMIAGKADTTALQEGLAKKLDSMPVSENVTNGTLVKRTGEGKIKAANGVAGDDVATISQLTQRLDKSTSQFTIYGVDNYGQKMFPYSGSNATPLSVMMRSSDGTSVVADPTKPEHVATKKYVDGRTPTVKVVSELPSSPDPQTVYLVTGA